MTRRVNFYAAKGGQGTTVTACRFALERAAAGENVALVGKDYDDVFAVLGMPSHEPGCGPVTVLPGLTVHYAQPGDGWDGIIVTEGFWWMPPTFGPVYNVLVTRGCYLALRRAVALPHPPDRVYLIEEPFRALGARDVEAAVCAPVDSERLDPRVAQAVDAGLLSSRKIPPLSLTIDQEVTA